MVAVGEPSDVQASSDDEWLGAVVDLDCDYSAVMDARVYHGLGPQAELTRALLKALVKDRVETSLP